MKYAATRGNGTHAQSEVHEGHPAQLAHSSCSALASAYAATARQSPQGISFTAGRAAPQGLARISEVVHQHALVQHVGATTAKLLSSLEVRNRRDVQLGKAADAVAENLRKLVKSWSPHLGARSQAALSHWANATGSSGVFLNESRIRHTAQIVNTTFV